MYGHERSLVEDMNGRPFVLLGVNSDKEKSRVKTAMKENNLNWRSFLDGSTSGTISKSFAIRSWPTIFLIDHNGVIQAKNLRGEKLGIALDAPQLLSAYSSVEKLSPEKIKTIFQELRDISPSILSLHLWGKKKINNARRCFNF